jgi:hypothetical protein
MNTSRITSIAFMINMVLPFLVIAFSASQTVCAISMIGGKTATGRPQTGNPKLYYVSQDAYVEEELMTREQLDEALSKDVLVDERPVPSLGFSDMQGQLNHLRAEFDFLDDVRIQKGKKRFG